MSTATEPRTWTPPPLSERVRCNQPAVFVRGEFGELDPTGQALGKSGYALSCGYWWRCEADENVIEKGNTVIRRVYNQVTSAEVEAKLNAATLDLRMDLLCVGPGSWSNTQLRNMAYTINRHATIREIYEAIMAHGWYISPNGTRWMCSHRGNPRARDLPINHITPQECGELMVHCHDRDDARGKAYWGKWNNWFTANDGKVDY